MKFKDYFDYTSYADMLYLTKYELAFCVGYFIFAIILALYSTPGGSMTYPDSIRYKLNADDFLSVFPNYTNGPIYPLLIAIGMSLGLSLEQSANIVPIISYSLLGFPLFLLGKVVFRPLAGCFACIITLLCGQYLLKFSACALTDLPYLMIATFAVYFLEKYNKFGYTRSLTFAAIFTLAAELTRPIGITLFIAGLIILSINYNRSTFKNFLTSFAYYSIIAGILFIAWKLYISTDGLSVLSTSSSNPTIRVMIIKLFAVIEQLYYVDYKAASAIIFIISIYIIIFLILKHQLKMFLKNTITLTIYPIIYCIILTIATSSLSISVEGGLLDIRKLIQIYPFTILFVVSLFIYYGMQLNQYKIIFSVISIILLTAVIIQGTSALCSQITDLRKTSIIEFTDREMLTSYISKNNISNNDKIYLDVTATWINYCRALISNPSGRLSYTLVLNRINGSVGFNKVKFYYNQSNCTIAQLIWRNNCAPIYMIVPNHAAQVYTANTSHDIYISNLCEFSNAFIFKASIPANSKFYLSNQDLTRRILDDNSPYKFFFAGNILPKCNQNQYCDQLIVMKSNPDHLEKDNTIQIIDFSNDTSWNYEYEERSGFQRPNNIMLVGDFGGVGYDQILSISRKPFLDEAKILDFNQNKSPIIINFPDALSDDTVFRNLTDADDIQLAADFLSLGHSQILFMDRSSNEKQLVLADFANSKSPQIKKIPLTGESARISRWLDKDDLQFAGDFMSLGHSQILFINRNHSKEEKEQIVIADFGNGNDSPSIKYQENWEKGSVFSGWIDANDTQLVGDFMNHGDSQMLLINHAKSSGKIMIVDFNNKKQLAIANYIGRWGQNSPSLFEGWLDLNDTKVAGDFKGLGYSQVMFLNNSINGLNASIVDFSSSRPTKLYFA